MPEHYDADEEPSQEELIEMGLDPNDPDYSELAAEGMTGDETDDEDLRDADDDVPEHSPEDED
jgi:hypothetical protein